MLQTEKAMVNALLEAIEETTIQTIDLTHPDVQLAINIWAEQSVAVQSRGWWYNRETYQLVLDARTGEIFFPAGVLEMDSTSTRYVKRGRKLYDLTDHTFIYTDNTDITTAELNVGCIMEWSLTELPPAIYRYALLLSKLSMVAERDGEPVKIQKFEAEANMAYALALKADVRFSDPNRQTVNNAAQMLASQVTRFGGAGTYRFNN